MKTQIKPPLAYLVSLLLGFAGVISGLCFSTSSAQTKEAAGFQWTQPPLDLEAADKAFTDYFKAETFRIQERCLPANSTKEGLAKSRELQLQQLREMFGLDPMPSRTDLKANITGRLEHLDFMVEKVHFQSRPGLYVTGNLYLPKNQKAPAPTILYLCGHSQMKGDGVSYGNKTGYQHWGSWFARNGYVCFIIDSVQLGEIQGLHNGTSQADVWWWNSRGYSPAAAEAWNSIRALDYLETRPEVDKTRLGVTGRSGGGAYSWALAALDERIKVACPTAGITDLQNHVVDGCISGHCPCMYMVNTYRWDYAQMAALVAPRPLLICNTDNDGIFPLDGVNRLYAKVRRVYQLEQAGEKLGLLITPGPHKDTEDLQVPVMRWFNKWLKREEAPLVNYAEKLFPPKSLRVFDNLPQDEITTKCQEDFTRLASDTRLVDSSRVIADLRLKTFGAWPAEPGELGGKKLPALVDAGSTETWEFQSCPEIALKLQLHGNGALAASARVALVIQERNAAPDFDGNAMHSGVTAVFCPSGAGHGSLAGDSKSQIHFRRRFMQLGGTLPGMQVWEVRRAIQMLRSMPEMKNVEVEVYASKAMTEVACFAVIFEPEVKALHLVSPPRGDKEAPDFLNWSRLLTPQQLLELTRQKCTVQIRRSASDQVSRD